MKADTHILSLDTTGATLDLIGGKGQSLASMTSAGFDVPGGFYITTTAYRSFIEANDLQTKIVKLAKPEIGKYTLSFDRASESIQALIGKPKLSQEIADEIVKAYRDWRETIPRWRSVHPLMRKIFRTCLLPDSRIRI